jgi:hypothetical protein
MAENVFAAVPRDRDEFRIIPVDFFRDGETVVVRGRVEAVAKSTGR